MIKLSDKDAFLILCRNTAILKHEIAVLRFNIAIPCFKTNNVSGSVTFTLRTVDFLDQSGLRILFIS